MEREGRMLLNPGETAGRKLRTRCAALFVSPLFVFAAVKFPEIPNYLKFREPECQEVVVAWFGGNYQAEKCRHPGGQETMKILEPVGSRRN